ncbi:MAG: VPA1262 family N-terminal domain-containing protein, partial [Hyphomicrobium sp.]
VPIEAPHAVDRFEMSIFNADGELLYRDGAPFIREVQFTMGLQGRKVQLDDDLARKANAQKKKDERPHGHVTSVTHERSRSTYAPVNENRERHRLRMTELRQRCFPAASHDKWFSRSLDDELGVIAHFDKLLNGGPISAAVLVDPFFSDDALVRLVLRLSSTDVKVTVVTSWTSSNPDTGRPLATSETPVTKLEALLRSTSPIVNPRLSVINLANGTASHYDPLDLVEAKIRHMRLPDSALTDMIDVAVALAWNDKLQPTTRQISLAQSFARPELDWELLEIARSWLNHEPEMSMGGHYGLVAVLRIILRLNPPVLRRWHQRNSGRPVTSLIMPMMGAELWHDRGKLADQLLATRIPLCVA